MIIDQSKCIGCGKCIPYCPVGAISLGGDTAEIERDICVECGACLRSRVCPVDAFEKEKLTWPRVLRSSFSDPLSTHSSTSHMGRGTEEVKTNDVTNLVVPGKVGIAIDLGRPGVGGSFLDAQIITKELASIGVEFHKKTPLSSLMKNKNTGELQEDVLAEHFLSVIIEFIVSENKLPAVLDALKTASRKINSVFSLAVFFACKDKKVFPPDELYAEKDYQVAPTAKINLGLGRRGEN